MKEMQRIKRLVIPLLKGLPIIVGSFLISLFIARKAIQYSTPKYQSMSKIKLDDRKYGMSGNNLYEDFDVFSSENKIETEAEILKSPLLVGKTVDAMGLDVLVSRVGAIKTTVLYKDNPFYFIYNENNTGLYDELFKLAVNGNGFIISNKEEKPIAQGVFGKPFLLNGDTLSIFLNEEKLSEKELAVNGEYEFQIKSRNQWIAYLGQRLDVKAIDKEIPVLRVVVTAEDPDFSADFANELCAVYVDDYIYTKSIAATKTLSFIDERMTDLQSVLTSSENSLEGYKKENHVVNTLQETETGLRELSKLKLQLINLEMEEQAIIELEAYISEGDYYEETAINFGFGDLLLTELVKKLKLYTDEKRDLLVKYTDNDARVVNVQSKIDDIEGYVKEAIVQNKRTIQTKRAEIELNIQAMSSQFDNIPTREKEMRILERDFQINETVYTFLAQKKLEAQIAASALMSFHRVIQPAIPAKEPVSPNKVLITFVCGFLGLIGGIILVFGGKAVRGRILSKVDIEKLTGTPVIGVLTKIKDDQKEKREFVSLATALRMQSADDKQTIVITSSTRNEGKSFVAQSLAQTYADMGYSVALIDANPLNPSMDEYYQFFLNDLILQDAKPVAKFVAKNGTICRIGLNPQNQYASLTLAHKKMELVMREVKEKFDYVIIDTPGSVISIDALSMLKFADLGLYLVRAKVSKAQYVPNVDVIQSDFGFENMKIVLNGAHKSTNYSGNFNGSRLDYRKAPVGIINTIRHYFSTYSK